MTFLTHLSQRKNMLSYIWRTKFVGQGNSDSGHVNHILTNCAALTQMYQISQQSIQLLRNITETPNSSSWLCWEKTLEISKFSKILFWGTTNWEIGCNTEVRGQDHHSGESNCPDTIEHRKISCHYRLDFNAKGAHFVQCEWANKHAAMLCRGNPRLCPETRITTWMCNVIYRYHVFNKNCYLKKKNIQEPV